LAGSQGCRFALTLGWMMERRWRSWGVFSATHCTIPRTA